MTITDIRDPSFCILSEKNIYLIEKEMRKLFEQGWYPVGGTAKKGNDWVQVMVRDKEAA